MRIAPRDIQAEVDKQLVKRGHSARPLIYRGKESSFTRSRDMYFSIIQDKHRLSRKTQLTKDRSEVLAIGLRDAKVAGVELSIEQAARLQRSTETVVAAGRSRTSPPRFRSQSARQPASHAV